MAVSETAWALRFGDLPQAVSPEELRTRLAQYGTIEHVHHLEGSESIVVFSTRVEADAAAAALSAAGDLSVRTC